MTLGEASANLKHLLQNDTKIRVMLRRYVPVANKKVMLSTIFNNASVPIGHNVARFYYK